MLPYGLLIRGHRLVSDPLVKARCPDTVESDPKDSVIVDRDRVGGRRRPDLLHCLVRLGFGLAAELP